MSLVKYRVGIQSGLTEWRMKMAFNEVESITCGIICNNLSGSGGFSLSLENSMPRKCGVKVAECLDRDPS